jgi:hypothetical protein
VMWRSMNAAWRSPIAAVQPPHSSGVSLLLTPLSRSPLHIYIRL